MRWVSFHQLSRAAAIGNSMHVYLADIDVPSDFDTHQPQGYTFWGTRYQQYQVLGVKYRITFRTRNLQPNPTTEGVPTQCIVYPSTVMDSLVPATGFANNPAYEQFVETTVTNRNVRTGLILRTTYNSSLPDKYTCKGFISLRRYYTVAWDNYRATFEAQPAATPYLNIVISDIYATERTGGHDVLVRLQYIVRLISPKVLTQDPA